MKTQFSIFVSVILNPCIRIPDHSTSEIPLIPCETSTKFPIPDSTGSCSTTVYKRTDMLVATIGKNKIYCWYFIKQERIDIHSFAILRWRTNVHFLRPFEKRPMRNFHHVEMIWAIVTSRQNVKSYHIDCRTKFILQLHFLIFIKYYVTLKVQLKHIFMLFNYIFYVIFSMLVNYTL